MSFQIKTTYYPNNPRKSLKGGSLYPKYEIVGEPVRLELVLNRPILHKHRMEFPLSELSSLDLSKFIDFRYLDTEALRDYFIRENSEQIKAENERSPGYGNLIVQVIDSWLSNPESLMKRVERLKSKSTEVDNYTRFLHPLTEFNEAFMGAARGRSD